MIKIKEYVKAQSLAEAYELNQKKGNIILGGMLWLKLQNKSVAKAIDLSGLGLDTIEETEEEFRMGAMVTLRQMEQHEGLNQYTQNAVKNALKHIVGVQFRNCATLGGSVFGRFGFSDVLPLLLAMDSYVELYQGGIVPMKQFAEKGAPGDILVSVFIKKKPIKMAYQSQRNTQTDFPVLNCAVSFYDGKYTCVVGARPGRAITFSDEQGILKQGITEESAKKFGIYIQEQVTVGSNMRASAEYRKKITAVLVKRALLELNSEQCNQEDKIQLGHCENSAPAMEEK